MDGHRHLDALNDAALEREIESALAVEPSPEFVARIRARVDAEPMATTRWTLWRLATSRTVLLVEAVAVIFIAATVSWQAWRPVSPEPRVSSTPAAAVATAGVTTTEPAPPRIKRIDRRVDRIAAASLSEVVIPENEKRGFELFLEELRDEKNAAVVAEAASGRATPGPPWLDIRPVIIEPLRDVATNQGEAQ